MFRRSRILDVPFVVFILGVSTVVSAGYSGTEVYLPSVGRGDGVGTSVWRTTLWMHNPSGVAADCEIQLLLRDQANPSPDTFQTTIPAGETLKIEDATWALFGIDGFGALRVLSTQEIIVNSRIYNLEGADLSDTQGQFFGGVPASFALASGESTDILGVDQASDHAFRYNFGFVETSGNTVDILVELLDGAGLVLGSAQLSLSAFEARQLNVSALGVGQNPTDNGRLHISVTGGAGRIIAFGSGIANTSQDPSTFEMRFQQAGTAAGDITAVIAGDGLVGGGTSGDVTLSIGPDGVDETMIAPAAVDTTALSSQGSSSGQVLTSTGTSVVWQDPPSGSGTGDITAVYAGDGLTGGGSTGDVSLSIADNGVSTTMIADGAVAVSKLHTGGSVPSAGKILRFNGTMFWGDDEVGEAMALPWEGSSAATSQFNDAAFHVAMSSDDDLTSAISGHATSTSALNYGVKGHTESSASGAAGVIGMGRWAGVHGWGLNHSGTGYGVVGKNEASGGAGVYGFTTDSTGLLFGVRGSTSSTTANSAGVFGASLATSGESHGLRGVTQSPAGAGVWAGNFSNGSGAHGVVGTTYGDSGWASGVYGTASRASAIGVTGWNTSSGPGLYAWSQTGPALIAKGAGTGNLVEVHNHTVGVRFRINYQGEVYADGSFHAGGADFAEMVPVRQPDLEPGDVVALAVDGRVVRCFQERQASVVGVVSTKPGYQSDLYADLDSSDKIPLAVMGIVPVKATAANGPIRPGDMLTPSAVPGHAMRSRRVVPGTVIGKAMEGLDAGEGRIRMLIMLR